MNAMANTILEIGSVVNLLNEILEDQSVPKNVRAQIQKIIASLKDGSEISIKLSKAMNELDDISSDVNIQSFTRTQIWNVVSSIEKLK